MLRSDESNVLENIFGNQEIKKKSYFERINFSCKKKDPFENKVDGNVWLIKGNKLLRKKTNEH
jgi:hypothetical protein